MMKALSLLGVLFLPATFTAVSIPKYMPPITTLNTLSPCPCTELTGCVTQALWEANLFQLEDETNKIVFAGTTVGLTLLVLGAWAGYMFVTRKPLEWYRWDESELSRESIELRPLV
jgi:hypothetical protein